MIIQNPTLKENLENLATVSVCIAVAVNVVKKIMKEVQKKNLVNKVVRVQLGKRLE